MRRVHRARTARAGGDAVSDDALTRYDPSVDAPREHRTDTRSTPDLDSTLDRSPLVARDTAAADPNEAIDRIWRRHHRWSWMRVPAIVLVIVLGLLAVGLNPRRSPQRAVDAYLPGVTLGQPVPAAVRARLDTRDPREVPEPLAREFLHRAPPLLVVPAPQPGPDGVVAPLVAIGAVPASPRYPTPAGAKASRVIVSVPSPGVARRVEARLRELYGRPRTSCYEEGVRTLYWKGNNRGGALLVEPTTRDPQAWASPYAARLVLGARDFETKFPRKTSCAR
jgi:hypothetical protein